MSSAETVLRFHYRTGYDNSIFVRGSAEGLNWSHGQPASYLSENDEDIWELRLPVIVPDQEIEFKPLLSDWMWCKGHNYIAKAGERIDIYPFFKNDRGNVIVRNVASNILNNERKVKIYLPPSYNENPYKRYNVLIMQDGHNLFDYEDSFCGVVWEIDKCMNELCCNRGIKETIVVGPYPVERPDEYLPTRREGMGGGGEAYLDFLQLELRPWVERAFRTIRNVPYGIGGSSWGGVIAFHGWLTRPDAYDLCCAMSPSTEWDDNVSLRLARSKLTARPPSHRLYMDCGTVEDEQDTTVDLYNYLKTRTDILPKKQFFFLKAEGHEHNETHWALRSPRAFSWLLADPQRVQYKYYGPDDDQ